MEWFKKHADSLMVIAALAGSMIWMNGEFSSINKDLSAMRTEMAVIKTVLLMKQILPSELAHKESK